MVASKTIFQLDIIKSAYLVSENIPFSSKGSWILPTHTQRSLLLHENSVALSQ